MEHGPADLARVTCPHADAVRAVGRMEHARGSVNAEGDVLVVVSGGVALSVLPHVARPVTHHLAPGVASRGEFKSSRVQGRVQPEGRVQPWSREYGGRKFEVRRMCVERRVRVQISV